MLPVAPVMIGTAGHVDHGKTSLLVRLAEAAPDADRLPEEQARGLTIDIGYAELVLDGRTVGVVDVPGHEKFLRNMVAAASGIDLILLVVAADDGVMPQTREHLEIADLLGASTGLVALTKVDLVDEELLLFAEEDVRDLVKGTFLDGCPIVRVSSATGEGIDELRRRIAERLALVKPKDDAGIFRMPVQRSFAPPGHGTVATGVPLSGRVRIGDVLEVVPGGGRARVRAIQAYHEDVTEARAGHRTALKLSDVSVREVRRGDVLATPDVLVATNLVEARFHALPRRTRPVTSNLPVRFHAGTDEVLGRLFLLEGRELPPGGSALVQLRLDRPVVVAPGDRYVLRSPSPAATLGGGLVIGASAARITPGRTRLVRRVAEREEGLFDLGKAVRFAASAAGLSGATRRDLARAVVRRPDEIEPIVAGLVAGRELEEVGERLLSAAEAARGRERLVELLQAFHRREPLRPAANRALMKEQLGADDAVLDRLVAGEPRLAVEPGGRIRLADWRPALSGEQDARRERIAKAIEEGDLATPKETELPDLAGATREETAKLLDLLVEEGRVVRVGGGVVFSRAAVERAKAAVAECIRAHGSMAPADLKDLLGMTRKYSIPFFEWLDATRFTVRQGDRRILG